MTQSFSVIMWPS